MATTICKFGRAVKWNTEETCAYRMRRGSRSDKRAEGRVWNNLASLSRCVIKGIQTCRATSSDYKTEEEYEELIGYVISEGPTESMREILECATGACAVAHIQQELFSIQRCIIALQVGLG